MAPVAPLATPLVEADGKVAFEEVPVFGVGRPDCHASLSHLFGLIILIEAVVVCVRSFQHFITAHCSC